MNSLPVNVLLIDDDQVDREAVMRGFACSGIPTKVTVARDGIEGLKTLRGEKGTASASGRYLILLDLNMPRMGGLEFLDHVRADPRLRNNVVFVFTTSMRDVDKLAAYDRHVAGYVSKSSVNDECAELIDLVHAYWRIVDLPGAA